MAVDQQRTRDFSNFRGVLNGLYHQEPSRLDGNPMNQAFVEAVETVTYDQQLVENDLRNLNGRMDPIKLTKFMQSVGSELGIDPVLVEDAMNDMALAEVADLQEESDGYEIGGDEPLDIPSMQHEWFVEGYGRIYGEPFDAKESMRQHIEEERYNEPVEQVDPRSIKDMVINDDAFMNLDHMLESTTKQSTISEEPVDIANFDEMLSSTVAEEPVNIVNFEEMLSSITDNPADSLMGASLNAPLVDSYEANQQNDHQQMIDFINHIREGDVDALDPAYKEAFEQNVNNVVDDWDVSRTDLQENPDLFKDWMAQVITKTDSAAVNPTDDALSVSDAYTVLNKTFGPNLSTADVASFNYGYAMAYNVPVDAYLLDMDQVSVDMGLKGVDGAAGMVKYKDVVEAESKEDMQALIDAVQRTIDDDMRKELDAIPVSASEPEDDGPEF